MCLMTHAPCPPERRSGFGYKVLAVTPDGMQTAITGSTVFASPLWNHAWEPDDGDPAANALPYPFGFHILTPDRPVDVRLWQGDAVYRVEYEDAHTVGNDNTVTLGACPTVVARRMRVIDLVVAPMEYGKVRGVTITPEAAPNA